MQDRLRSPLTRRGMTESFSFSSAACLPHENDRGRSINNRRGDGEDRRVHQIDRLGDGNNRSAIRNDHRWCEDNRQRNGVDRDNGLVEDAMRPSSASSFLSEVAASCCFARHFVRRMSFPD